MAHTRSGVAYRLVRTAFALLLGILLAACDPGGLSRAQAVETAIRIAAPLSDGPVTVESATEGPLGRFVGNLPGQDATRRVWAVALVGSFEGEGVMGNVPRYRHHLVILDFLTGEYVMGSGSS
jgi:hypothetical protein